SSSHSSPARKAGQVWVSSSLASWPNAIAPLSSTSHAPAGGVYSPFCFLIPRGGGFLGVWDREGELGWWVLVVGCCESGEELQGRGDARSREAESFRVGRPAGDSDLQSNQ